MASSPFYYARVDEIDSNGEDHRNHYDRVASIINWDWADNQRICSWVIQPRDRNSFGSVGDYLQVGNAPPTSGISYLFVRKNHLAVKPATRYDRVSIIMSEVLNKYPKHFRAQHRYGPHNHASNPVYVPACDDPDYIGIGLVFGRPNDVPPGDYYCVHKSYIQSVPGASRATVSTSAFYREWTYRQPYAGQEHGWKYTHVLRRTNNNTHVIWHLNEPINLLDDVNGRPRVCNGTNIKIGGMCNKWCIDNPNDCDALKQEFCRDHPNDSFCDCLNSPSRPEYQEYVAKLKPQYQNLYFGCNSKACNHRNDLVDVYTTNMIKNYPCPSFDIIDQSIQVTGDNNILDTKQEATMIKVTAPPPPTTNNQLTENPLLTRLKANFVYIFLGLLFIVAIAYASDEEEIDNSSNDRTSQSSNLDNNLSSNVSNIS